MSTEDCTICLETLERDSYSLNCNHHFHRDCITRWLHTSPNCPLCRQPVDADTRYVDDGIMTEERRLHIENLKAVCVWTAKGLEWLFPQGLQGYTQKATEFLESDEGREMLESAGNDPEGNVPTNLLLTLGASGLTQYIANGGLTALFKQTLNESDDDD